jgi:hypothetical protein
MSHILKFEELAIVMGVQFANRLLEVANVAPIDDDDTLESGPPVDSQYMQVSWEDKDLDRTLNIDQYDERFTTPAAIALVENFRKINKGTYKFFKPKLPIFADLNHSFVICQNVAIRMFEYYDVAHDICIIRVEIKYKEVE